MVNNDQAPSKEIFDPPGKPRKINYGNIVLIRERVIEASEEDEEGYYEYYYDEYHYTFKLNGYELYASCELFDKSTYYEVYFRDYKPPNNLGYRIRQCVAEKFYDLASLIIGKTEWWVTFNLYHPEPSESCMHSKIPYGDKLFQQAVCYLVKEEKAKTIRVLTSSSSSGYSTVNTQEILSKYCNN